MSFLLFRLKNPDISKSIYWHEYCKCRSIQMNITSKICTEYTKLFTPRLYALRRMTSESGVAIAVQNPLPTHCKHISAENVTSKPFNLSFYSNHFFLIGVTDANVERNGFFSLSTVYRITFHYCLLCKMLDNQSGCIRNLYSIYGLNHWIQIWCWAPSTKTSPSVSDLLFFGITECFTSKSRHKMVFSQYLVIITICFLIRTHISVIV